MLPSVDVVIPVYNEEKLIGRCLDSLKNLDYPEDRLRVFISDNFSRDRSIEIASTYNVTISQVKKQSIAHTRNVGARLGNAEIIAFVDSDCVVDKGWLKNAVPHFFDPCIVAAGSYPVVITDEVNAFQRTWSQLCKGKAAGPQKVDWLSTQNLLVRRTAFQLMGGFNEELITCEDADLGFRLGNCGVLVNDPAIIVYHLREPRNYKEFWKKEFWHSQSNLAGAFSHGFRPSELPSLIMPIVFLAGAVFLIAGLAVTHRSLLWLGLLFLAVPPFLYSAVKYKESMSFVRVLLIYFIYFSARAASAVVELSRLIAGKMKNR
ncbi:MAG: glycosyltransferase [Pseudomonadota bacterium]